MEYIRGGRIEDFPANSCRVISLPDGEPVVVINLEDELHVLEGRCSHSGHSLEHSTVVESEDKVLCPWHGWEIDLDRGVCLADPERVLKSYPVRVENGEVLIGR